MSRQPPINPAFAIAEVIWMLAGSNDAAAINYWNRELPKYAGATSVYPGAYGHRLRYHFGFDQIRRAVDALKANPESRQIVLQLWDTSIDLPEPDGTPQTSDVPCNLTSILKLRNGRLDWTQIMRSNDVVRGLPYNIVQFTTLQEIVAGWLGVQLGTYHHWSDSLHLYESDAHKFSAGFDSQLALNNETLTSSLSEGETFIADLYGRLLRFSNDDLSRSELECLSYLSPTGSSYQSLLGIMAAEAARRRSWFDLMSEVEQLCTNNQLRQVWTLWKLSRTKNVHVMI
ncbi:MAG: thymidylate synthase [Vicinamibacterales bacterium]